MAVAGIAATALVGIAGTAGALVSARADRHVQRVLARDARTYERRVSAYLDVVGLVEKQDRELFTYALLQGRGRHDAITGAGFPQPLFFPRGLPRGGIPWDDDVPVDLTRRLRVFGSAQVFNLFEKAEATSKDTAVVNFQGGTYLSLYRLSPPEYRRVSHSYSEFHDEVGRLEQLIHSEVGT